MWCRPGRGPAYFLPGEGVCDGCRCSLSPGLSRERSAGLWRVLTSCCQLVAEFKPPT